MFPGGDKLERSEQGDLDCDGTFLCGERGEARVRAGGGKSAVEDGFFDGQARGDCAEASAKAALLAYGDKDAGAAGEFRNRFVKGEWGVGKVMIEGGAGGYEETLLETG